METTQTEQPQTPGEEVKEEVREVVREAAPAEPVVRAVKNYVLNPKLFTKKKQKKRVAHYAIGGFISVSCEPQQRRRLEAISKNEDRPFAEIVRLALQIFIESYLINNNLPVVKDQSMVVKGKPGRKRKYELREIAS